MPKRIRVVEGNLIGIPLDNNMVAVGIILHVSREIKDGIMVGYYDQTFPSIQAISIDEIDGDFIDTPNYTGKQLLTKGPWQIVEHSEELLAKAKIPMLAIATTIYFKDEIVKQYSFEERHKAHQYPTLKGQGGVFVENKLRKHFANRRKAL